MKISNEYLTASFHVRGAELASLKKAEQEYVWQAHPEHWARHAPVLFPIVGKLKDNTYLLKGAKYEMGQHGFARDQEFEVVSHDAETIVFALKATEETLKLYPFRFELRIEYSLSGSSLQIAYQVQNTGREAMPFSIGAHPAFNCPLTAEEQRSDYWLSFPQHETFMTHRLISGNFSGVSEKVGAGNELRITDQLFDQDALVFKGLKSTSVSLQSSKQKWLTFYFEGFPYLGIWSKSARSPFICIEPWYGLADHKDHNQDIYQKEGILMLSGQSLFSCDYQIRIH